MDLLIKFFHAPTFVEIESEFNAWSKGSGFWVKDTQLMSKREGHVLTVTYGEKSKIGDHAPPSPPAGPPARKKRQFNH